MREVEINLADINNVSRAIARVDAAIVESGLVVTSRGTLVSYPGCTHWHVKRGRETGTLEITVWPARKRAWFKVASNRAAGWIDGAIEELKHRLEV
jgi:hypothetical protein